MKATGKQRQYSREFKQQAMDLVRVQGNDPTPAARSLDIPPSTFRKWLDQAGWGDITKSRGWLAAE